MDPYLGEIRIFAGTFAPKGWAYCDGSLLLIRQYTALYALLGTIYGGDGRTTFGLPDLRGRLPVGIGQGPGLSPYYQGQSTGVENVALDATTMGAHSHLLQAVTGSGDQPSPGGTVLATFPQQHGKGNPAYTPTSAGAGATVTMSSSTLGSSNGVGQPHSNLQPYLTLGFIIALQGIFPPRP